jgi:hypothetical protein
MSDDWKCVTIHSADDDPIMYVVDGEQEITRVNIKKGLPASHIEIIEANGFEVTIHDSDECYDDE